MKFFLNPDLQITMNIFGTNEEPLVQSVNNYMGMSPCPSGLSEYSASYKIA